ncbi:MAG: 50S ribosomal protein L4 [Christensenellaceae bacterium]|jgi:large subunit ribosomal protein L4|nr:50S ribosomal protein L4 [Christensenellaceae bacterium]
MIKADLYNTQGAVVGSVELDEAVFGQEYNEALIHQVIVAQLANKRYGTKSTLTRTEVRGGGRKPWRQKGTGNARQGSIRAVQWIKGGVAFAPKPRDFSKKVNKAMKYIALRSALSAKLADGDIIIVDKFEVAAPKTKLVYGALKSLKIETGALVLTAGVNESVVRASRNIETLRVEDAALISVYDVARAKKVVLELAAVKGITEVYA